MRPVVFLCLTLALANQQITAQELSVLQCMQNARENSTAVKIAQQSLKTRENLAESTKNNYLPKVDVLAGYNRFSENAALNLQGEKDQMLNYGANNISAASQQIYQHVSGNPMPSDIQNLIYDTSRSILGALYPSGNLPVGKKDYLLASISVRQPIYLGGKLKAANELATQQAESGKINLENTQQVAAYSAALQYIRILYLNTMIARQSELLAAQHKNETYAENLVKAQILPPYQKSWASVAVKQSEATLQNYHLEKQNALLTLNSLMGADSEETVTITSLLKDNLPDVNLNPATAENTDIRLLSSKKREAETTAKLTGAVGKPNIFAIGNAQLFRRDLPIVLPPFLVGIEMQWTVFDYEKKSRNLAAKSLVDETDLLITQKEQAVDLAKNTTRNTLEALENQVKALDEARRQSYTTTEMVRKRMENSLSSVKDVNDALQLQIEAEKFYYTALAAYHTALETWFYLQDKPEGIANYID